MLGLVHGHTHAGGGKSHVGFTPIFNPGPLKDGEYAILTLRRSLEPAPPAPAGSVASKVKASVAASAKPQLRWRVEGYEQRKLAGMLARAALAE